MATLIGPEPTNVPPFNPPFRVEGDQVFDAHDREFAQADPRGFYPDLDREMAQAIADALNEKFASATTAAAGNAEFFVDSADRDNVGNSGWYVVDGRAYYRYPGGHWSNSAFSVEALRHGPAFTYRGRVHVNPAEFAHVEGRE